MCSVFGGSFTHTHKHTHTHTHTHTHCENVSQDFVSLSITRAVCDPKCESKKLYYLLLNSFSFLLLFLYTSMYTSAYTIQQEMLLI